MLSSFEFLRAEAMSISQDNFDLAVGTRDTLNIVTRWTCIPGRKIRNPFKGSSQAVIFLGVGLVNIHIALR
ncbi:hypothetical protein CTI10_008355 [Delftia acidovorans]|uniref:Uncharacterized protein n=1 Tax=Chryseobacterium sp. B5 TaxID=2050562 RepID=A0A2G7T9F2_9FLAO|nr:hypothetical protein CTI10_008355 [Delftia acidovorans]